MVLATWSLTEICIMLSCLSFQVPHGMAECPRGKFGAFCNNDCHCEEGQCDVLGHCINGTHCQPGFAGISCQNVLPACEHGWFGIHCEHKCLCTGFHCDRRGQCMSGARCKSGFFGPSCQYGDVVQLTSVVSTVPLWLRDGDEATCNTDSELQSVTIKFLEGISFSWFRICMSQPDFRHSFDVTINDNLSCSNARNATVDDKTIDVYCDVDVAVHGLTLTGASVLYLCSVYVSLGRNLASRKTLRQTPVHLNGKMKTTSLTNYDDKDKSVDTDSSSSLCAQTGVGELGRWWNYSFDAPQTVSAFLLTKRNEIITQPWITLKTFSAKDELITSFDAEDYYNKIYFVRPRSITSVTINSRPNESLSLCQVFIFGEVSCPEGTYGLDCDSACDCDDKRDICLPVTGRCADPCPVGFYGFNCSMPCPGLCQIGACTHRDGNCIVEHHSSQHDSDWNDGRSIRDEPDNKKTSSCPIGYYGPPCIPCPNKCNDICDRISGICLSCDTGFHGNVCSLTCESECKSKECFQYSGICTKGCEERFFGNFCDTSCGQECSESKCNSTTGKCFKCSIGYVGENCVVDKVTWNVTLFIILLFLIPSVIACFFCCEVFSEDTGEDQNLGSFSGQSGQHSSFV